MGRMLQPVEHPIDLASHNKIVLVQPLNLLGAQRDGRVTPPEAYVRMVPLGFSQLADVANKVERCPKITEMEGSFDAVAVIAQLPVRSLRSKVLRFRERKRRNASATESAFLLGSIMS